MPTPKKQRLLIASFESRSQLEGAVDELRRDGFREDQIGVAMRDCLANQADRLDAGAGDRAVEGLAAGALAGGVLGAATSLLIPGLGLIAAWGILVAALEGSVLGASAGGLIGGLSALGLSKTDARFCEREFKKGRPIVVVTTDGRSDVAREILEQNGAYDVRIRCHA